MYDEDSVSSHEAGRMPRSAATARSVDDGMSENPLVSLYRLQSAFAELVIALNETFRDERSDAAACPQRAQTMLQGVDRTSPQPSKKGVRQGLAPWQVRSVLAHIEANLAVSIRNKDLAVVAGLSEFHFNVAFRRSIGRSPHVYVVRRRMELAQGLMLSTDKTLSEIAAECGFADQPHFTRLFRRAVGESPAAWRRPRADPRHKSASSTGREHCEPERDVSGIPAGSSPRPGIAEHAVPRGAVLGTHARSGSWEPLDDLKRLLGDFPPTGVDRQRVSAAWHLGDLGHARVAFLQVRGRRLEERLAGAGDGVAEVQLLRLVLADRVREAVAELLVA
jgi:AraC family transcriptional regulator